MIERAKIPNYLTFLRVTLIPIFVLLMLNNKNLWALGVFIIASLTDYLDGYFARKWNLVSDFGKLMDPIADKILVMAALVMLVAERDFINAAPWVPAWIVVLILAREIWVNGIRNIAASRGVVMAAGQAGKIKSFLQMVAICLLLLHDVVLLEFNLYRFTAEFFGIWLLLISVFFSYWGAVDYTVRAFDKKKE